MTVFEPPPIGFYERLHVIIFGYLGVPPTWLHSVASLEKTRWFSSLEFLGSHTTPNGRRWYVMIIVIFHLTKVIFQLTSPRVWRIRPSQVDTCPRDALDRPKTDPQYARNSSGKGLDTLEHASLEKTQGFHTWPSKSRFTLEPNWFSDKKS